MIGKLIQWIRGKREKVEVRCWLEPSIVKELDQLIGKGEAGSRSEAIRKLLLEFLSVRPQFEGFSKQLEEHEKRISELEEALLEQRKEAVEW